MHNIDLIFCLSEVAVNGAVYSRYRAWFVLSPILLLEPPYECSDQSIQCGSGECLKRLWMISSSQKLPEAHNVPVGLSYCAISLLGFDESPVFFGLVRVVGGVVRVVRRVVVLRVVGRVVRRVVILGVVGRVVVLRVVGRVVRRVVILGVVGRVVRRVVVLRVVGGSSWAGSSSSILSSSTPISHVGSSHCGS